MSDTIFKLYRIKIKLLAPLLVGYVAPSHNLYDTLKYIPAPTLRGSLATFLLKEECTRSGEEFGKCHSCSDNKSCRFFTLFENNLLSITDGAYLCNLNSPHLCNAPDIIPSHPLLRQCKACKCYCSTSTSCKEGLSDSSLRKCSVCNGSKYIENKLSDWIEQEIIFSQCKYKDCQRKTKMEPIKTYYCRNDSCGRVLKSPSIGNTTSTSINYASKSSLEGHLFQYNYIQSGSIFESYLFTKEDDLLADLIKNKPINIWLGRGRSRGFGKVELDVELMDLKDKINRNTSIIEMMLKKHRLIIAAKTSIFSISEDQKNFSGFASNPLFNLNNALKRVMLRLEMSEPLTSDIFKLIQTLGNTKMVSGWSLRSNQPKPHLITATPGSLYKFSINNSLNQEVIEALAYLEFFGLDNFAKIGYNLIFYPSINNELKICEENE